MSEADGENQPTRTNILALMDGFIDQMRRQRKIMLGMSMSAIVLGPLAIALSAYLIFHPSFFAILEHENEFGLVLGVLLAAVILHVESKSWARWSKLRIILTLNFVKSDLVPM